MTSSVGMMTFPIDGKIKNVPNHQPDIHVYVSYPSAKQVYSLNIHQYKDMLFFGKRSQHAMAYAVPCS